jgi:hypothetical protein
LIEKEGEEKVQEQKQDICKLCERHIPVIFYQNDE